MENEKELVTITEEATEQKEQIIEESKDSIGFQNIKSSYTEEDVKKLIQSETDKVRGKYSKELKELQKELEGYKPKEKSESELQLEQRLKAVEDKEKEIVNKEKSLKALETLKNNGLDGQLVKYLNLQGVEDLESYIKEVADIVIKHTNKSLLDNSFIGNKHKTQKDVVTKEQFGKMSYLERVNLFKSNAELYKKLSSK